MRVQTQETPSRNEVSQALRVGLKAALERGLAAAQAAVEDVQKAEALAKGEVEGSARCGECQALLSVDKEGRIKAHKPANAQGDSKDCPGSNRFGKILGGPDAPVSEVEDGAKVKDAKAMKKAEPDYAGSPGGDNGVMNMAEKTSGECGMCGANVEDFKAHNAKEHKFEKEARKKNPKDAIFGKGEETSKRSFPARHFKAMAKSARERDAFEKSELAKVAPPGEEKLVHKLKDEYGHDAEGKSKAFATAWSIHDKMKKSASAGGAPMEKASIARAMKTFDTKVKAATPPPAPAPTAKAEPEKIRGSVLARQRGPVAAPGKSPAAVRGTTPEKMATPTHIGLQFGKLGKATPPPVPAAARPGKSPEGLPLAGAKIPPRPPGSAMGAGKMLPPKLPGMPDVPGAPKADLVPVTTPKGPRAPTMASVKVPGVHKAEPGVQTPADQAAVAGANKQLGGFKSIAKNPTAMPGGKLGKAETALGVGHHVVTAPHTNKPGLKGVVTHEQHGGVRVKWANGSSSFSSHADGGLQHDPSCPACKMAKGELCKAHGQPMNSHKCS